MSKNKNRKRNADLAQNTGRITDRPKRKEFDTGHVEIQISGPKHFHREDDSVHIVAFKLNKYLNSVPLTTAELRELRAALTTWLADPLEYCRELAETLGLHLVGTGAVVDKPEPPAVNVARIFDVPVELIEP